MIGSLSRYFCGIEVNTAAIPYIFEESIFEVSLPLRFESIFKVRTLLLAHRIIAIVKFVRIFPFYSVTNIIFILIVTILPDSFYFHYFCALKILQHDYSIKSFDSIR